MNPVAIMNIMCLFISVPACRGMQCAMLLVVKIL